MGEAGFLTGEQDTTLAAFRRGTDVL